jgi:hypothetical protein
MSRHYHQGRFIPTHPEKYIGDVNNIIFRSSWEKKAMIFFDTNPNILAYNSEECVIPYLCETDGKMHRYFPDFTVKYVTKSGEIKMAIVEVKPDAQTRPPKPQKRNTQRFMTEANTYIKNQSKWKAAKEYAASRGFDFMILTEHHIFGGK